MHGLSRTSTAVALVLTTLGSARAAAKVPATRKVAQAANTLGMQRYRSGDLAAAAEQFKVAIDFDGSYVTPHYNLACVASRLHDAKTAVRELKWLDEPSEAARWAKLAKATGDPDLDFVSVVPEVRVLLGLRPFSEAAPPEWLSERSGVWSFDADTPDCSERHYTLAFKRDGALTLEVREQCKGKDAVEGSFSGRLGDGGNVEVSEWKAWPGAVPLKFESCPGMDAPGSCFTLSSGKSTLGPFYRGRARPKAEATATRTAL